MKIKNKARLVARAKAHRKADHFIQGIFQTDPGEPFKGCEIGCLSAPVRMSEKRRLERKRMGGKEFCTLIGREFGVCEGLLRWAEDIFEGSDTLAIASAFVVSFTEALPEGADISDSDVEMWDRERREAQNEKRQFLDWLRRGCPTPRESKVVA